jgi:hypothetical protein
MSRRHSQCVSCGRMDRMSGLPVGETAASARDAPGKAGSMTSGAWPDDALYDLQAEV